MQDSRPRAKHCVGGERPSWTGSRPTQSVAVSALCHIAGARTGLGESGLGKPGGALSPSASPRILL